MQDQAATATHRQPALEGVMTYLQVYKIVTSNKVVSKIVSTGIVFNNSIKENLGIYKSNKVGGF